MKRLLALFLLLATPVFGQGTGSLQNHAIPIGKGPNVRGFTALGPSSVQNAPLLNTPNADPAWGSVPALNLAAGTGISINVVGTTATISSTATGGVTSLGAATGAITLGTGFSIPSNVLTYTQDASTATTIQNGTGAVSRTVKSKLNDLVNIADYGAVCNGVTNDTTAIQNAWNYAATIGADVWLGGVGTSCVITQLTMPTPVAVPSSGGFNPARSSMLKGPGSNQVSLLSNVTGTNCAITVSATYGVNGALGGSFSGFGLRQSANAEAGIGICFVGITKGTLRDVRIVQFGTGFSGIDTILINIQECFFSTNLIHINGDIGTNSNPNSWNIDDNHFDGSGNFAIHLVGGSQNNIRGNDFESNGLVGTTNAVTIYASTLNASPTTGINVIGNYFEGNKGTEIAIDQNSFAVKSVHNVTGNTFLRNLTTLVAGINILNSATVSAHTTVNVAGNSFLDTSGGTALGWMTASTGTANTLFNCSQQTNEFAPTTNVNATCLVASTGFR